jgi:hypothetical protein
VLLPAILVTDRLIAVAIAGCLTLTRFRDRDGGKDRNGGYDENGDDGFEHVIVSFRV